MKKIISEKDIKEQKELEQKLTNFIKVYEEINKDNLIIFNADVQKDFFVERLLYINNKLFIYKEKITIDQIINNGGVIIPYKQGVGNVTINQRVNLLEGDMKDVRSRLGRLEDDMIDVKTLLQQHSTQINGMQTQLTDVSTKIDRLTDLLTEHIKNHK